MCCVYNSRDISCKEPFGALPTGAEAKFSLYIEKKHPGAQPVLLVYPMDEPEKAKKIPMALCEANYLYNRFCCTFASGEPQLFAYHFEAELHGKPVRILRGADANATVDGQEPWQLTVYDAAAACPAILREGVMYQIFPDRFFNSGAPKTDVPADRTLRGDWGGMPHWRPNKEGQVTNSDYFGGDLQGILEKLEYLASLGITCLYLNPVFEAHSNHRYNTADYRRIDPLLGSNEDFRRLCAEAKQHGISIILDGVFSHTGCDSVYFNKNRRYGNGGAYHDKSSPYFAWYQFTHYPNKYKCWWDFPTLPNVEETEPTYLEFICGENGVLRQWLDYGASGFRLDVADELPDAFLDALYARVKHQNKDNAVIGEVWEDASNKTAYGKRRRYLLGKQMDGVMNYVWKDALLHYMRYGWGEGLYNAIMQVLENYPKPAIQSLMNSLSTHDSIRAITALGGEPIGEHGREWQERHHPLNLKQYLHGCQLFKLAAILQFGLPGIPCVYYGDEAGLYGYKDPFNRLCYPWGEEDTPMLEHFTALGKIRSEHRMFAEAAFIPLAFGENICAFERRLKAKGMVFAVNRSDTQQKLALPPAYQQAEVLFTCGGYRQGILEPLSGVVLLADGEATAC